MATAWRADAERTSRVQGDSKRPDILIKQGGRMPVAIECEWKNPAVGDAQRLIGKTLVGETRPFTEVIAVGISEECSKDSEEDFQKRLENNEQVFTIQLVSKEQDENRIWPDRPLTATPNDLIAYCEYAQVPQAVISDHSAQIANRVESAGSKILESINLTSSSDATLSALRRITGSEHDEPDPEKEEAPTCPDKCEHDTQATRTTCAIWLVAIDLQNDLAQYSSELQAKGLQTTQAMKNSATLGCPDSL